MSFSDAQYRDIEQQFVYTQSRKALAHMLDEAGMRQMTADSEKNV
jgi:hypothetical protein